MGQANINTFLCTASGSVNWNNFLGRQFGNLLPEFQDGYTFGLAKLHLVAHSKEIIRPAAKDSGLGMLPAVLVII